jgi:hypothetical protein
MEASPTPASDHHPTSSPLLAEVSAHRPAQVSPRDWIRPVLIAVVGLAVAAVLVMIDQWIAAVALALCALFLGYWTSPLRSGRHTPFLEALAQRGDAVAIILWAPGDPLSSRLQPAVRTEREDVVWVNVQQDHAAQEFMNVHGGRGALPVVIVGDEVLRRTSVGDYLDAKAEGEERAAAGPTPGTADADTAAETERGTDDEGLATGDE